MAPKVQEKWLLSYALWQDANASIALELALGKASMFSSEHMDEQNGLVHLYAEWIYVGGKTMLISFFCNWEIPNYHL